MEDTAAPSRLARIRQLLDQASAGVQASYQGLGAFWQLPLPQLLGAELYGVRLIAPAPDDDTAGPISSASAQPPSSPAQSSCCHAPAPPPSCCTPPSAPAAAPPQRGRGAASGLVKGLKGEAPFDGNPFPRLPWGGRALAAQDIALVEQWIDDGCPEQDTPADPAASKPADGTPDPRSATRAARAGGHEPHPPSAVPGNLRPALQGGRKLRKNVDALTPEELRRLRAALRQMHRFDAFELDERGYTYWARIHGNNCQHGWEQFLPWHRLYLHFFEQALQDIDPSVTVPYWDWSAYHAHDQEATTPDSGVIPAAFRCYVDDGVLAALDGKIPAVSLQGLRSTVGQDFNSGLRLFKAAGIAYGADPAADDLVFAALTDANPLFHRFRWPGGNNALLFEDYPAPQDVDNILALDSFHDFGSGPEQNHFYGAVENLHNLIHNFCGGINPNYNTTQPQQNPYEPQYGDMVAPGITAFDPIFWAHHANVDRLWAAWQQRHPGAGADNPGAGLPPWPQTVGDCQSIATFGCEYAHSQQLFPTEPDMDLTRLRSAALPAAVAQRPAPSGIAPDTARPLRAELRLNGVQHRLRGGVLRIFINEPDADAKTPTRGNPHYAGQFHLFAGDCIGGEGHCSPPPRQRRAFDQRPRHRKTPGQLRLDVSAVLQRLRARGDTSLHVHVLALDHAGQPAGDVLRLDSLALVFFDEPITPPGAVATTPARAAAPGDPA